MKNSSVQLGVDVLLKNYQGILADRRIGVLAHSASVSSNGAHIIDTLSKKSDIQVNAVFGPEHGLKGHAQDMELVVNDGMRVNGRDVPVHSLYGASFDSLKPTKKMFDDIDVLVVDLQDIGTRYYTYIYTMAFCMEVAAACGKKVVVCDRPNPINGCDVEGMLIEKGYQSFVGWYPLPVRHGMTIGELAGYFNKKFEIGCELQVIKMEGWTRDIYLDDAGVAWSNPSPNMRSIEAALLYPGMCLLEGTNISEGRGTDAPFEKIGAPWIDSDKLIDALTELNLPGIVFETISFTPNARKYEKQLCKGIRFKISDRKKFKPYLTGLALIWATKKLFKDFGWMKKPYEFIKHIPAIDLLTGSSEFRNLINSDAQWKEVEKISGPVPPQFLEERRQYLLYS